MKKNKTIAYMLAATLLVGGTFMGTKAFFTDSATASNDLVITMGNVDLLVEEGPWKNENEGTEASQSKNSEGNIFKNVKPNDRFIKEMTIKNNGSLKQVIKLNRGEVSEKYPNILKVGETITSEIGADKTLNPGEEIKAYINVQVMSDVDHKFNEDGSINNENKPSFDFNKLVPTFEINAEQEGTREK
ncbi:SipW-dependent-type signal peptide-containing protein [Clostridium sp. CCUG 7971]|uniref:SipW-dependent-type signal peptide-containing protein n=1 Tax=Clostridium sp. CCUG 7971 TaxID=2811414 RepID=UPI001ABADC60|nr:SipW-dependent-type signal peptide-containing protein [Clostridium sp. CCUG 7971]MBO3444221.1 hypothetical protein [Clostridium sp. CCUG 7971]